MTAPKVHRSEWSGELGPDGRRQLGRKHRSVRVATRVASRDVDVYVSKGGVFGAHFLGQLVQCEVLSGLEDELRRMLEAASATAWRPAIVVRTTDGTPFSAHGPGPSAQGLYVAFRFVWLGETPGEKTREAHAEVDLEAAEPVLAEQAADELLRWSRTQQLKEGERVLPWSSAAAAALRDVCARVEELRGRLDALIADPDALAALGAAAGAPLLAVGDPPEGRS